MNSVLPYEESLKQGLMELPLPDENFAWVEMKKLLDEDDDDPVPILPILPIRWGCGIPAIFIGLLLVTIGWLYFTHRGVVNHSSTMIVPVSDTSKSSVPKDGTESRKENSLPFEQYQSDSAGTTIKTPAKDTGSNQSRVPASNFRPGRKRETPAEVSIPKKARSGKAISVARNETMKRAKPTRTDKETETNIFDKTKRDSQQDVAEVPNLTDSNNSIRRTDSVSAKNQVKDSAVAKKQAKDSILAKKQVKDSTVVKSTDSTTAKKKKEHQYSWGAGLAINQNIPTAGQSSVPYNSLGRKGVLTDYIPSAFLRFYRDKKWFIQGEFRYGAPQYTKDIQYSLKKNTGPNGNFDSSLTVKKTYYHQVPISVNYYILPGLSIGTGIVWNSFKSALSEQRVTKPLAATPDSLVSDAIVASKGRGTNFSKSYLQLLGDLQFSRKRMTIGARYTQGLQPYLKFQLPSEPLREEKNSSIILYFRYELWRSKAAKK